jgi:UDP-N-acetylglucosamine 2-epimerase (non-hydrolysing)
MSEILHVVGARPNFVKMAPVIEGLARRGVPQAVAHTGQHYDAVLSDQVLADLNFPQPDAFLGIGSGTHAEQTARALVAFERVLIEREPELVVVAGDVNSTLACALAAAKLGVPVAHVESGLRSFDTSMPEEINRVLTDRISALLFTHSPDAIENLLREGASPEAIHSVGNTMIDSLRRLEPRARERAAWEHLGAREGEYVLVTLHRPSNVDDPERLAGIAEALIELAARAAVLFPVHPRTQARLEESGLHAQLMDGGVTCIDPVGYIDFISLELGAGAIATDSGGLQEEATALGVPCYTLRPNTERPITLDQGTNTLLGDDPASLSRVVLEPAPHTPCAIPLWDGCAGDRVATILAGALEEELSPMISTVP